MTDWCILGLCLALLGVDAWRLRSDFSKIDGIARKWTFFLIPLAFGVWFFLHCYVVGW